MKRYRVSTRYRFLTARGTYDEVSLGGASNHSLKSALGRLAFCVDVFRRRIERFRRERQHLEVLGAVRLTPGRNDGRFQHWNVRFERTESSKKEGSS